MRTRKNSHFNKIHTTIKRHNIHTAKRTHIIHTDSRTHGNEAMKIHTATSAHENLHYYKITY